MRRWVATLSTAIFKTLHGLRRVFFCVSKGVTPKTRAVMYPFSLRKGRIDGKGYVANFAPIHTPRTRKTAARTIVFRLGASSRSDFAKLSQRP